MHSSANVVALRASASEPFETTGRAPSPKEIEDGFQLDIPRSVKDTEDRLVQLGIPFDRHGPYHLKIGYINYYPSKGSVMIDGQPKFKGKGFTFLLEVLKREGYYRP